MISSYKGVPVGKLVLYSLIKTNVFYFWPIQKKYICNRYMNYDAWYTLVNPLSNLRNRTLPTLLLKIYYLVSIFLSWSPIRGSNYPEFPWCFTKLFLPQFFIIFIVFELYKNDTLCELCILPHPLPFFLNSTLFLRFIHVDKCIFGSFSRWNNIAFTN